MSDPEDDWDGNLVYRIAYGHASAALDRWDGNGRRADPAEADVFADVCRIMGPEDEAARETIREAVGDALARRRPRW